MVAYIESPLDRIVNVHFGGGFGFVIAEVNPHYMYLASLTPPDPEYDLDWIGLYAKGDTIPSTDYRLILDTTANLVIDSILVTGIADTFIDRVDGPISLNINDVYPITGEGIPPGTTMTYTGETVGGLGHGTLSSPATANTTAGAIHISLNWLFKQLNETGNASLIFDDYLVDTSTTTPQGYQVALLYDGSTTNRTHTDDFWNTLDAGQQARHVACWFDSNIHTDQLFYNGQQLIPQFGVFGFPPADFWPPHELTPAGGPVVASVLEVIRLYREFSDSFIVLPDRAQDVAVMQKSMPGPHPFITPGFIGGVILRGYPGGGTITVGNDWHLQVRNGGNTVAPAWTATVTPRDPPPMLLNDDPDLQRAHFNINGLL